MDRVSCPLLLPAHWYSVAMDFKTVRLITFDCYGTLIDWETGMLKSLHSLFANVHAATDENLLQMYSEIEPEIQAGPYLPYRTVLARCAEHIGRKLGVLVSAADGDAFAESLKQWQPFPDTVAGLQALSRHYKLGIISNIDDDLFAATNKLLQTTFDLIVTARQVQSYKPSPKNFHEALRRAADMGIQKEEIVHAAQSLYHDIAPANSLGIRNVWVNRHFGKSGPEATRPANAKPGLEVHSVAELAKVMAL